MWKMYDTLLDGMKRNDSIEYVRAGDSWVMVKTRTGLLGVAAIQNGRRGVPLCPEKYTGMQLSEASKLVKSWELEEAALGLAAINTGYNRSEQFPDCGEPDAFLRYRDRAEGKKVAVVGRFPYLEKRLKPICELLVLERKPRADDYPDQACEYILPKVDMVFITGCTVSNKTLPRLLQLSENAYTILTGPSTPMVPKLFDFGVDALCGFCVTEEVSCVRATEGTEGIFNCGRMVCLEKEP